MSYVSPFDVLLDEILTNWCSLTVSFVILLHCQCIGWVKKTPHCKVLANLLSKMVLMIIFCCKLIVVALFFHQQIYSNFCSCFLVFICFVPHVVNEEILPLGFTQVKKYFRDKTLITLLAVVTTNLLKNQPTWYHENIFRCLNKTVSVKSYARCIVPMILRRKKRQIYENKTWNNSNSDNRRRKKRFFLDIIEEIRNQKWGETKNSYIRFPGTIQKLNSITVSTTTVESEYTSTTSETQNDGQVSLNHFDKFPTDGIADTFYTFLRNIKRITGPWIKFPNITLSDNVESNLQLDNDQDLQTNALHAVLENFMKSPILILKDDPDRNLDLEINEPASHLQFNPTTYPDTNKRILSPRMFHMFKEQREPESILSPDLFSMYEGGNNNVASIPTLLNFLSSKEKTAWMRVLNELTGTSDILKFLKSISFADLLSKSNITLDSGQTVSINKTFDILPNIIADLFSILSETQISKLNSDGYAFLNELQLDSIYKERKSSLKFNISDYNRKSDNDKELMLYDEILNLANGYRRVKRQKVGGNNGPTILTPFLGGTTLTTYLLSPTILSPSLFSYILLGPLVLSPFVFSPYVFGPFILSPEVLTPFIFSPFVLSPTILGPAVLSPNVFNSIVLSPYILSPSVLNPNIFSPPVLSATILSPGVLSPSIYSDGVLSDSILSPCLLCKKRRKRKVSLL